MCAGHGAIYCGHKKAPADARASVLWMAGRFPDQMKFDSQPSLRFSELLGHFRLSGCQDRAKLQPITSARESICSLSGELLFANERLPVEEVACGQFPFFECLYRGRAGTCDVAVLTRQPFHRYARKHFREYIYLYSRLLEFHFPLPLSICLMAALSRLQFSMTSNSWSFQRTLAP